MKRNVFILLTALCIFGIAQAQVGVYRSSGVGVVKKEDVGENGPLTRNGKVYFYHGKPMTEKEMVNFVQQNCEMAYQHYEKSKSMEIAGWSLLGSGIILSPILGSALLAVPCDESNLNQVIGASMSFYVIGAAVAIVSVPLICVGSKHKKDTHKVYNTWCGYKELEQETSQLEFRLQTTSNGLGCALSF